MALRAIMLNKKLAQKRSELAALQAKDAEFVTREAELETAIEEANTEEEQKAVEESITELENEKKENEDAKTALEETINGIEAELEDIRSKDPGKAKPATRGKIGGIENRESGVATMINRGIFKGQTAEQRSAFCQREDMKQFAAQIRSMIGQKQQRGVTGADLTIPEIALELLRDNMHRYSKLIKYVTLKSVKGKARQNIAGTVPEGIWTEMVGTLNELSISFNQVEVDGYKVGGYISIANSYIEDSDENLIEEVLDALGQSIGLAGDKAIVYGKGTKMPYGIVTRLAATTAPANWGSNNRTFTSLATTNLLKFAGSTLEGAKFFQALVKNCGKAKANYSNGTKIWCMSTQTYTDIMAQAVMFNAAGAIVAGVNNQMPVIGGDIVILDFIPDGDIVGGYISLYVLAERKGGTFAYSDLPKFVEDMTIFKGTARYDGKPVIGEGFVVVNINNTAPTTSVTFAADTANTTTQS